MKYGTSSRNYQNRARARLQEGSDEALFYAALELRCGVEQRLREHLEFQDHISEKLKTGWQISKLGRATSDAFRIGDRIVSVTVVSKQNGDLVGTFYYTPVTSELRSDAARLGNYLHAPTEYHSPDDPWWAELRALLDRVYHGLVLSNIGTLYGPPILDRKTGRMSMPMLHDATADTLHNLELGAEYRVRIEYLDSLPDELKPAT